MGEYKGYIIEEGDIEPGVPGTLIYDSEEAWRKFTPTDTALDMDAAKRKIDEGEVLGELIHKPVAPEVIPTGPMTLETLEALDAPIERIPEVSEAVHLWIEGERNIGQLQRLLARHPEIRDEQVIVLKAQYGDRMIVYHGGFLPTEGVISVSVLKHVANLRATAAYPTRAFEIDTGRITMAIPTIGEQELIVDVRVLRRIDGDQPKSRAYPPRKGVIPKLPEEARRDFLFAEYIRDLAKFEALSEEDVQRLWEGFHG